MASSLTHLHVLYASGGTCRVVKIQDRDDLHYYALNGIVVSIASGSVLAGPLPVGATAWAVSEETAESLIRDKVSAVKYRRSLVTFLRLAIRAKRLLDSPYVLEVHQREQVAQHVHALDILLKEALRTKQATR
jgi:hypothetical protein